MENTYKTILNSYAKRLISTSSRSRTIYYSKDDKNIADVSNFINLLDIDAFYNFLNNEKAEIKLSYGACSTGYIFEIFDNYVSGNSDEESILKEYPTFTKKDFSLLKKNKKSTFTELYNKYELVKKKQLNNLLNIKEKNDSNINSSGKDDLYLGYPYIQGRFNKDKIVRAPLVLHKISVKDYGENVIFVNEGTKLLNPVFVMTYLVENDLIYKDELDFEIFDKDYMKKAYDILKKIGISYDCKIDDKFVKMSQLTKKEFKEIYTYQDNKFEILNHISLGIFPLSDKKIYDDVVELRDSEEINEMLNKFYDKNSEISFFDESLMDIDENNLKYITTLDYSQKKTLQDALKNNCVIQGPPGTGKSQVIVNIAANFLLSRNKVLFCSEKRTATDVIYNRLGKLSSFALLLHNHISEKNSFYKMIVDSVNAIKENIEKYKNKAFNFNENYKINNFFNDAKKYYDIVNKYYNGLSFSEVMIYKNNSFVYEKEFNFIDNYVNNCDELVEKMYKYEGNDEYQNAIKCKLELNKEYYKKYKISFSKDNLFDINKIYLSLKNIKNNYIKNVKVSNFINESDINVNLFKKIINKKEKLNELSSEFFDSNLHDFSVFDNCFYLDEFQKNIFLLKFKYNLSDEEIIENYKTYISKKVVRDIDFSFLESFSLNYEENMNEAFKCMDLKKEESIEFIARNCSADIKEKLASPVYSDLLQKLLGEINRKRKPPIKVIIDKYFEVLKVIFPIWIMTPDVVSAVVPLKEEIFDKVIFDEASQMFIEKAIPSISRGKSVVICGDSKQLRPTLFFESRYDDSEEDIYFDVEQESALTESSLLDYATSSNKYVSNMLSYHYRCDYKELINFSNYAFYDGKLTFASNSKGKEKIPLETINVEGNWDGEKNVVEAKRVVELIKEILFNRKNNETIGVVCLNVNQRDLIYDYLDDEAKKDNDFANLYYAEKIRVDEKTGEDKSIFVKNLESVQGDERDIIIFSISYSKNEKGNIGSSLGEIQRQYGENRLNVAISRAKKKIYIIKSFMGNELQINDDNVGPSYFKKYLQYADCLNSGDEIGAKKILESLTNNTEVVIKEKSWLGDDVYCTLSGALNSDKYVVYKQFLVGSFVFDLVVYDKANEKYVFAIEFSGLMENNNVSNEIYRHYYLKVRGWQIYKLWVSDWLMDKEKELNKLIEYLNSVCDVLL